jgi:transcriptional regulator with XRE-family HTH domain
MPRAKLLPVAHRPHAGWLRAAREARGLSLQAVADKLDVSPQAVHQFEQSEVAGTISLRQLAHVAAALGCKLTYALEGAGLPAAAKPIRKTPAASPASAAPAGPVEPLATAPAAPDSPSVEHSMFLQNQADGRFD